MPRSKKITEYTLETTYPKGYEPGGEVKVEIVFRPDEMHKFVVQSNGHYSYHWLLCDAVTAAQERCAELTSQV